MNCYWVRKGDSPIFAAERPVDGSYRPLCRENRDSPRRTFVEDGA